jgi:hypothetical protein
MLKAPALASVSQYYSIIDMEREYLERKSIENCSV